MGILQVVDTLNWDVINAVVYGVLIVPLVIAAYYFAMYFKDRSNKDNRTNLPIACVYSAISCAAQCAWAFLGIIIYGTALKVVLSFAISVGISFIIFSYCYGVCKRFATQ